MWVNYFGLFLNSGDGSRAGYWFYEGCQPTNPPIVLLSSDGHLNVLASSIEEFLSRLVEQVYPPGSGYEYLDFYWDVEEIAWQIEEDENIDETHVEAGRAWDTALRTWLGETWNLDEQARQQLVTLDPISQHPRLDAWFENWEEKQKSEITNEPIREQIRLALRENLSIDHSGWLSDNFDAVIVGSHFELWYRNYRKKPYPNTPQLEPLFRQLREEQAQKNPAKGLWFSAYLRMYQGGFDIICNFEDEPEFEQGQPTLDDFLQDLERFPRSWKWRPAWLKNKLIDLAVEANRYDELVATYANWIELDDEDWESRLDRADSFADWGKHEAALQAYDQVIAVERESYRAWYNRGNSLRQLGQQEAAIASYDEALKAEPDADPAWYNRCLALNDLQQFEAALQSCEQALRIRPDKVEALYMKAFLLVRFQDYSTSLQICDQVLLQQSEKVDIWYLKGWNLNRLEQHEQALLALEAV